jgi:hypothetical protein
LRSVLSTRVPIWALDLLFETIWWATLDSNQ